MSFLSQFRNPGARNTHNRRRRNSSPQFSPQLKVEALEDRLLLTHTETFFFTADAPRVDVLAEAGTWQIEVVEAQGSISAKQSHISLLDTPPGPYDTCFNLHFDELPASVNSVPASAPNGCGANSDLRADTNGYPFSFGAGVTGSKDASYTLKVTYPAWHPENHNNNQVLHIDNVVKQEGSKGTTQFLFRVSRPTGVGTVSLDFTTVDGTAKAGEDYTTTSGTLTFAEGETVKTIVVVVKTDRIKESDEVFSIKLSNPTLGWSFENDQGFGTILNDD